MSASKDADCLVVGEARAVLSRSAGIYPVKSPRLGKWQVIYLFIIIIIIIIIIINNFIFIIILPLFIHLFFVYFLFFFFILLLLFVISFLNSTMFASGVSVIQTARERYEYIAGHDPIMKTRLF